MSCTCSTAPFCPCNLGPAGVASAAYPPMPAPAPLSVAYPSLVEPEPPADTTPAKKRPSRKGRANTPWLRERMAEPSILEKIDRLRQTPEGCALLEKWIDAEYARGSFFEFFKQAWSVVEPSTELVINWHHKLLCSVLQALFMDWLRGKRDRKYVNLIRNVAVNIPPGTSKSKVISVCFMAWCWLHFPGMRFIALSVNDEAAMRDARDARMLIESTWYRESFGVDWALRLDQDAVSNFGNSEGGNRISMAAKSEIVGLRGDCICNDDPNNPKKAESRTERKEINDLWSTNQYNRVNDPVRSMRIIVQQRTNAADLTGFVIDQQGVWSPKNPNGWLHIVIPAEFDPSCKFVLPPELQALLREFLPEQEIVVEDPRTEENETLDVERMPRSFLDGERERWRGTGNYAGQMQQRPSAAEGAIVQRAWFNFFRLGGGVRKDHDDKDTIATSAGRVRPAHCHDGKAVVIRQAKHRPGYYDFDWITVSVDPASRKKDKETDKEAKKKSNYGILVVAGKGGRRYVLDDRSQRGHLHEIMAVLKVVVEEWEPDSILIEPKAAGPDVMSELNRAMGDGEIPMIAIEEADPGNQDKEMRLEACLSYFKNGMVHLLDGASWLQEFVDELAMFPNGLRNDRVDALSQVLNHARDNTAGDGAGGLPDW